MRDGHAVRISAVCRIGRLCALVFGFLAIAGAQAQIPDQEAVRQLLEQRQRLQSQPVQTLSPVDMSRDRGLQTRQGQKFSDGAQAVRGEPPLSAIEADYNLRLGRDIQDLMEAEQTDPAVQRQLQSGAVTVADPDGIAVEKEKKRPDLLRQYGYDLFRDFTVSETVPVTGRLPDRYVLGVGDELVVTFVGSVGRTVVTTVDREGRVVLSDLAPIDAAGRTFAAFEAELKQRVSDALLGTDVFLSVGSLRQISVTVVGEVARPGLYRVTSQTDLLQLLAQAGGVRKTGSLRKIVLFGAGKERQIDLYTILDGSQNINLDLHDGDRLFIPLIGPTLAVDGAVTRPGIYELPDNAVPDAGAILRLAGGAIRPRGYRIERNRIAENGRQKITDVAPDSPVMAGDVYRITPQKQIKVGQVGLEGHVYQPGLRALSAYPTLSALLGEGDALKPGPYTAFAVLKTVDERSYQAVFHPVDLGPILTGSEDLALKDRDTLYVMGPDELAYLSSEDVRNTILLPDRAQQGHCKAIAYLGARAKQADSERLSAAARSIFVIQEDVGDDSLRQDAIRPGDEMNLASLGVVSGQDIAEQAKRRASCNGFFEENPEILPLAIEYAVVMMGAVREAGLYPAAEQASLRDLVAFAGGLSLSADPRQIEISTFRDVNLTALGATQRTYVDLRRTSLSDVSVYPGSTVRFAAQKAALESGTILLSGEFNRPGVYTINKGETLLDVMERAGGLTDQAYPYGAVFTRVRVKQEQQESFRRTARELNNALALAMLKENISGEALAAASGLVSSFASVEAAGRVVVEADPLILRQSPDKNMILEGGDAIHMPKRPNFVMTAGDLLNPGALQFSPGKQVGDYLAEAGGFQETADEGRVFIVFPNGVAQPVVLSRWSRNAVMVPPGSTIVVPKDVNPLETLNIVREITQVLSNLAVSAASVAVISR